MAISSLPKAVSQSDVKSESSKKRQSDPASPAVETQLAALFSTLSTTSDLNALIDLTQLLREHLLLKKKIEHAVALRKGVEVLVRSLQTLLAKDRIPVNNVADDGMLTMASSSRGNAEALSEAQLAVTQWLQARWNDAVLILCQLLACQDAETRVLALHSLMNLQRDASSALTRAKPSAQGSEGRNIRAQWSRSPWRATMLALLEGPPTSDASFASTSTARLDSIAPDVLGAFTDSYLQEYDDVRFAFCRHVETELRKKRAELISINVRQNTTHLLLGLTAIPTKQQHLNTFLVKEIEGNERFARKAEKSKGKATPKEADGEEDEEEEVEDWFSDSEDEDAGGRKASSNVSGLGKAAQSAADAHSARRKLKRNPAFCDAVFSLAAQRAAFSRAWLAVLLPSRDAKNSAKLVGGQMTDSLTHEALMRMHTQILPHLSKPNMLHDFLVDSLDNGGATALLALNTLFTLMTKHNLNYPAFYTKLYALLQAEPPVLHVRYRSRFLRMLDVFLSSTHLPATLVASFAKRLSRVALRAPPPAIVVVIPFVWNLCKRHKHCLGLLHREFGGDRFDAGPIGFADPYDASEPDPLKSNAIESSLWELAAMGSLIGASQQDVGADATASGRAHYLASVSSLSRILAEPFTKERYGLEDFLDLTYATMFDTEVGKTLKRRQGKRAAEPAVAFSLPRDGQGKRVSTFGLYGQDVSRDANGTAKRVKLVEGEGNGEDNETGEHQTEGNGTTQGRQESRESQNTQHASLSSRLFSF